MMALNKIDKCPYRDVIKIKPAKKNCTLAPDTPRPGQAHDMGSVS